MHYKRLAETVGADDDEVMKAYVTFKSQEGRARAIEGFKHGICEIFLSYFLCCCGGYSRANARSLNGKRIEVKPTVEPETINWHNFGVSRSDLITKNVVLSVMLIILLFFEMHVIIIYENDVKDRLVIVPNFMCGNDTISALDAFIDYRAPAKMRNGNYHCFCSTLFVQLGNSGAANHQFTTFDPADESYNYC